MLRIVAGKYRHLIINQPNTDTTRPTMDKVREAIFSSLGYSIVGKKVLDLFAGSGAMGLEALSRGAIECTFVDNNALAISTIKKNVSLLKIEEKTSIIKKEYLSFLSSINETFDILFLDPPYKMKKVYDEVIEYMLENNLLSENAIIVKECDAPFDDDKRFYKDKKYKYGSVHVQILWR